MKRSSGILLPIFSLPGPWGIGCFDQTARQFAKQAARAGFSYWQILPLNPTTVGDSPYQSLSAYAGNPYLIDLLQLYERNLLTEAELNTARFPWDDRHIDYGWLYETREPLLRQAFSRLSDGDREAVSRFAAEQASWLRDYALFRAIKKASGDRPWWEWENLGLRRHVQADLDDFAAQHALEIEYHTFVQFEFDRQWRSLKADINALGIRVIGDMPIYVAGDSADVWARKDLFEIDEDGHFQRVAGVPPDYFTADGQLWGNPLYRWDKMADEQYAWWLERIGTALRTYDVLRIDHFRGFESYWAVPAGDPTARNGVWEKGPAMQFFDVVLEAFPNAPIIAEDLGDINDEVRAFLDVTGLPGMKVMQFGFDGYFDGGELPHAHVPNSIVYSGTHDNTTLVGWWQSLDDTQAQMVHRYIRYQAGTADRSLSRQGLKDRVTSGAWIDWTLDPEEQLNFVHSFLQTLWISPAKLAVAPVQDFLALDASGRINTPGTHSGNWRFRLTADQFSHLDVEWIRHLNQAYFRMNTPFE
jgi:4-alpha-glucanotransferase